MEMKANQTLRHLGSGIQTSLPTTMLRHQVLPLTNTMAILPAHQTRPEVGKHQSHLCPLISVPSLTLGLFDMLQILRQWAGGHL
jgi:hypothetical protein